MSDSLVDTHTSALLVIERAQGEGEVTGLLLDLGKDGTGSLHLELVVDVVGALVDGRAGWVGLGLFVSTSTAACAFLSSVLLQKGTVMSLLAVHRRDLSQSNMSHVKALVLYLGHLAH